tara:strand:- start:1586 stop:2128 length:543 start_codon:yes stop_codon:yes gene_type:complete
MQKSEFIAKIKTLAKKVYAEKSNPGKDPSEIEVGKFPVLDQFPPLKDIMDDLFDFQYEPFVEDIEWVAPRPTTFRVKLVNGADFYLTYQGKDEGNALFVAQIAGKKYFLESLPEEQQASEAIARLLRFNYAATAKPGDEGLGSDLGDDLGDDLGGDLGGETPATEPADDDTGVPATVDDL